MTLKGLISTTRREELERTTAGSQEFHVYDDAGRKVFPGYDDFAQGGIFFAERTDHIEKLMACLLAGESLLGQVMRRAAPRRDCSEFAGRYPAGRRNRLLFPLPAVA